MKKGSARIQPEKSLDYRFDDNDVADFDNVAYRCPVKKGKKKTER